MPHLTLIQDLATVLVVAGAVAWLCHRAGISVVVGYLVAGTLIGPYTPPFSLVADVARVHTLAALGLVFVMFFVGLGLSLSRLRSLGLPVVLAALLAALFVIGGSRLVGVLLGLEATQGLFLAGVLVVSSSVIVGKTLSDLDADRQRFGQLALGITVLEDAVAVAMLAVLGAVAVPRDASSLVELLSGLAGVVLVAVTASVLAVPRLLARLRLSATPEIQTILLAGLVLALSWLMARAGYSLALGAFLLGSVVGGTRHRARVEQSFEGLRDIFAAVFFVSMGMLFEVRLLLEAWPWALGLALLAIVGRWAAVASALGLVGESPRDAARAGLATLPLGEFSFVIAQLGVASGVMPPSFYAAAIGASLLTAASAPGLVRFSEGIGEAVERLEPDFARAWRAMLARLAGRLRRRRSENLVFKLVVPRLAQAAFEAALVVSALLLSSLLYQRLEQAVGPDWPFPGGLPALFWTGFGLLLLLPTIALWRNLGAIGMILGEALGAGVGQPRMLQHLVERSTQAAGFLIVLLLATPLLPGWALRPMSLLPVAGAALLLALLLRSRLIRWHSRMQADLVTHLGAEGPAAPLPTPHARWNLRVHEHPLSDLSAARGRTIAEVALRSRFGCTVVGIDRQGVTLSSPGPQTLLFPNDRLLLLGSRGQLAEAVRWLDAPGPGPGARASFDDLLTEDVTVPHDFAESGRPLEALRLTLRFGVHLVGLDRAGRAPEQPSASDVLRPGDGLLVLGTTDQNRAFKRWLSGEPGPDEAEAPADPPARHGEEGPR